MFHSGIDVIPELLVESPKPTMEENIFPLYVGAKNIYLLLATISLFAL